MLEHLGDDVRRQLARFGPASGMADLVDAWPGAVGDSVARHAWPARVARDGTLHVATSSSVLAFELQQLEREILTGLRAVLGGTAPAKLRFAVGKIPDARGPEASERTTRAGVEPAAEHLEKAGELTAAIADEGLRETVARAVAASLARARSDRRL